ncbi:proline-rich transmembrane protein 4-like [Stigmatopora nigra]
MLFHWNFLIPAWWLLSFHVTFLTGEHSSEPLDSGSKGIPLGPSLRASVSWEDGQEGVLGEYSDVGEASGTTASHGKELEWVKTVVIPASLANGYEVPYSPIGQTPTDRASKTGDGTTPVANGRTEGTVSTKASFEEVVSIREEKTDTEKEGSKGELPEHGSPPQTSTTTFWTALPTWTSTFQDEFAPSDPLGPSLEHSSALFVPLYSDWNTALAAWGFAWEAHVYGLGSIFSAFGLISALSLLGLPFRCPSGSPYFTLLHFFVLGFAGTQAFRLLYDAYAHQDVLPPLSALLLSQLPFPCLTAAFSLAFFLLSLRSRKHLSLSLAISPSLSALPKPRLLLFFSLAHFAVSLGCVGVSRLFHGLPATILLLPQGAFVCSTLFLSFSYLVFYCLIRVDAGRIYKPDDEGECGGGSPDVVPPTACPFAKAEDWSRAAGAGVGAALCLLGCGGLHFYGILHALGLDGLGNYGLPPWPWWGYQTGCRVCEAGACLGLSLIGTRPLFCGRKSSRARPKPGSWSRLSCSSPGRPNSPVISWSQNQSEKKQLCDGQSEVLALGPLADSSRKQFACVASPHQSQTTFLPKATSPARRPKNMEYQFSFGADSTADLCPPSPIDLSRSIDQALFSESLFRHSIFGSQRLFPSPSSRSLGSPERGTPKQGSALVQNSLYRTTSCSDLDQDIDCESSQAQSELKSENLNWKESNCGSTLGLCSKAGEIRKLRSNSWANRGQSGAHNNSLPRAISQLSYHRRYRTLSVTSKDGQGSRRLGGTKQLSESKQLEWDTAAQAEFVDVCRQIDSWSVCSDTIEL